MDRRTCAAAAALAMLGAMTPSVAALRKPWPRGRPTPDLRLSSLEAEPWTLGALRGHPVLLNFWASWCEPCRDELPALERFARDHADAGLRIVAVNYRESRAAIQRFLAANPTSLAVLQDPEGAAARAFGVNIFPSTVAIDRRGRVLFVAVGELDGSEFAALAAALLAPPREK